MNSTLLGLEKRGKGFKAIMTSLLGNAHHLWMWDQYSLTAELQSAGFRTVRSCRFNDSADPHFKLIEDEGRFSQAVALEAVK